MPGCSTRQCINILKRETETFSSICNARDVAGVVGHEIMMHCQGAYGPLHIFKHGKKTNRDSESNHELPLSHGIAWSSEISGSVFD